MVECELCSGVEVQSADAKRGSNAATPFHLPRGVYEESRVKSLTQDLVMALRMESIIIPRIDPASRYRPIKTSQSWQK